MASVTLQNVGKVYAGGVEAVQGVTLAIPDGSFKLPLPACGERVGVRGRQRFVRGCHTRQCHHWFLPLTLTLSPCRKRHGERESIPVRGSMPWPR